jgi:beta-lactamase regulating signal transducer with metallopeptidase domain
MSEANWTASHNGIDGEIMSVSEFVSGVASFTLGGFFIIMLIILWYNCVCYKQNIATLETKLRESEEDKRVLKVALKHAETQVNTLRQSRTSTGPKYVGDV